MTKYDDSLFEDVKYDDSLFEDTKYDDSLFEDVPVSQKSTKPIVKDTKEEPGLLETVATKGAQGAMFGTLDEIGAGIGSAADWVRRNLGIETSEEEANRILKEKGFTGDIGKTMEEKDILSQYRDIRDVSRAREKEIEKASPVISTVAEIAGGIAPAIATGGASAVASAAKTGLKQAVKQGAKSGVKFGGAYALGTSEADLTKGELAEAAKDVALGGASGAVLGGALPVLGKGIKTGAKKTLSWLDDVSGELGQLSKEAAKATRRGQSVTSKKGLAESTKKLEKSAEKIIKLVNTAKGKAKDLVSKSVGSETKINITDDVDTFITKVDDNLANFTPDSQEAKVLGNLKAKFQNLKNNLLKEAGQDPTLPTKKEAYQKLLQKKADIDAIGKITFGKKEIDNLFNKAAKLKGKWEPDMLDAERIKKDFKLGDTDSAIEMLKDIAKLKITRPKFNKRTGKIEDTPFELVEVLKRYEPKILEREGRVMLERAPGVVRESEALRFRPDELPSPIELKPQQMLNLRDDLRGLTMKQDGIPKKVGAEIDEALTQRLKKEVSEESKEQFEKGMGMYKDIYDVEDVIPGISKGLGDRADTAKTIEKAQKMITNQMSDLEPTQRTKVLEMFKDRIGRISPEDAPAILDEAAKTSKLIELQDIAFRSGVVRALGAVETVGVRAGAALGRAGRVMDKLRDLPTDTLQKLAGEVQKVSPKLSNFLNNLSQVDNAQRKAALLFSASQKPDLSDEIEALLPFGDEQE